MEAEQILKIGGEADHQEFFRILAEMLANSVMQDLTGSAAN